MFDTFHLQETCRDGSRSRLQLGEPAAHRGGCFGSVERLGEDGEHLLVRAEIGEVGEREIHRPDDTAGQAELAQLGALAFST